MAVDRQGVVTDASFAAKRLVMGIDGAPVRSRAGKLLLHDCSCDTLRSLGYVMYARISVLMCLQQRFFV